MRDILRLSITLALVGILSASLLTYINGVTAPIIAERQEAEYRQALELFFPDFDSFESEQQNGDYFDLIYDSSGNLIGIMSTIQQQGYDGYITYNLAVDGEGVILGLIIISHSETPGIGDIITTDSFKEQFIGKSYEDPITAGEDVDIVSGATVSTSAMISSVRRVAGVIAEKYLGQEKDIIDFAAIPDGIYQGTAPGLAGPLTVVVEVAGGMIVSIEVLEHSETPTYFIESYPLIPERIIAEQQLDVDTETGATLSAESIVDAVRAALSGALEEEGGGE
jgi:Na+-translocating ferredoxin:NAD+ oxidoreductase subunit G